MNVQQPIKDTSTPVVLSVAFNNNAANFSVGLDTGICGELDAFLLLLV